jgi:hypothetical protein
MDILEKSSKDLLYDESNGCGKEFTQLCVVLELLKLKAYHGWSDNSFLELLSLLAKLLPKSNTLPTSTYKAKKLICPLSLRVEKIHACPNHCILYCKESGMWCESIQEKLQSCVHRHYEEKDKKTRTRLVSVLRLLMTKLILIKRT